MTVFNRNHSLRGLNTFGIDVSALYYTEFQTVTELQEILNQPEIRSADKLVLGGGSNILFTGNYNGAVLLNRISGINVQDETEDDALVSAGAGENWHSFVLKTMELNLGGLENLSLIPGCVGAAPIQNIGAYGVEIKDTFHSLEAFKISDCTVRTFSKNECAFGYRDSIFKNDAKGKYIITSVTFRLSKKPVLHLNYGAIKQELVKMNINDPTIRDVSNAVIAIRQSKLPDPKVIGNAGSFFKNPEVNNSVVETIRLHHPEVVAYPVSDHSSKLAAGWLIEQCGWKGKRIGNVGMHEKQALVLVNYGNATGMELVDHAKRVQQSVKETFGVHLEMEVNII
jgi:UDP-N-acetylmuramate dehydrogenase